MFIKDRNVKYLFKSCYWEKLKLSNIQSSKFKKYVTKSVLGELQSTQLSLHFINTRGLEVKMCATFLLFLFQKSSCVLLIKNIIFNKNKTQSIMTNLVLQLVQQSQLKIKTVMSMSWSPRNKKEGIFCDINLVTRKLL